MIDQIGGWSTAGVGQAYGEGYSVSGLNDFMLALYYEAKFMFFYVSWFLAQLFPGR